MVDVDSDRHHGIVDDDHICTWVSFDIHVREQDHEKRIYFCDDRPGIRDYFPDLGRSERSAIQKERERLQHH